MCRCVQGACEEFDWSRDVELVGEEEEEQEVITVMIFMTFHDIFLTDADEEFNK